ncbi:MAG: metal-sulfur cluster assembly factor [Deltaproteobacteria bacterium]|nr:metal-sulfur cluster assembly factor [Deltaproteobacteria bacterium]
MTADELLDALREVIDPELGINIVDLGLVDEVTHTERRVRVRLGMTSPACPVGPLMRRSARDALLRLPGVEEVEVLPASDFRWSPERMSSAAREQLANRGAAPARGDLVQFPSTSRDSGEAETARGSEEQTAQPSRSTLAWQRLPLLAAGLLSLVAASWGGLVRLGWPWPIPEPAWVSAHGPLMVCGFLGTLIGVERAVGIERRWAFAGPIITGLGALSLLTAFPGRVPASLMSVGSLVLVAVFSSLLKRQRDLATVTMGVGALCWLVGNLLWLSGFSVPQLVPWWMAFLVLTIAGERLELSRFLTPPAGAMLGFGASTSTVLAGCSLSLMQPDWGVRVFGLGLLGLTAWLARHDVARATLSRSGLPRFVAVCVLSGYCWLAVSGALGIGLGSAGAGPNYDAFLHTLFVGFSLSMVFGHAPIIFPSVLNRPLVFRRAFYFHLIVLHTGLVMRLAGDMAGVSELRLCGGLFNAAAIGIFLINTIRSIQIRNSP